KFNIKQLIVSFPTATDPICSSPSTNIKQLNKRMNGKIVWHSIVSPMSASVSDKLISNTCFNATGQTSNRHALCIKQCVKIEYKNKILILPIVDITRYIVPEMIDITQPAFEFLTGDKHKPQSDIPFDANITFTNWKTCDKYNTLLRSRRVLKFFKKIVHHYSKGISGAFISVAIPYVNGFCSRETTKLSDLISPCIPTKNLN
ncbi:hypothetical protein Mgra_00007900, partial [Meloidogyne graminicola]